MTWIDAKTGYQTSTKIQRNSHSGNYTIVQHEEMRTGLVVIGPAAVKSFIEALAKVAGLKLDWRGV